MIKINLLPAKASRKLEVVKQELALAAVVLGIIVLLCAVVWVLQNSAASDLRAEKSQLQHEIDSLKAVVARVDEIDKIKQELTQKLTVIDSLKRQKSGPVHVLDELSMATPEKVSLEGLRQEGDKLSLDGVAVSNEVISQFLSNLERSEWFDDVYLVGIQQKDVEGYKLKDFEVTARITPPKTPEEIEAEKAAKAKAEADAAAAEAKKAKSKVKAKAKAEGDAGGEE